MRVHCFHFVGAAFTVSCDQVNTLGSQGLERRCFNWKTERKWEFRDGQASVVRSTWWGGGGGGGGGVGCWLVRREGPPRAAPASEASSPGGR